MVQTVDYVEQRSADLSFYLFESSAPRRAVRVLAERSVSLSSARLTLAIIGSSHFLEIEAGNAIMCEMVACRRQGLEALASHAEAGGSPGWVYSRNWHGLSYGFESWRRRLAVAEFAAESARLSAPAADRQQFVFPRGAERWGAITCMEWHLEGRGAVVSTYHTFPSELTIVHTRSVIDIAEAGASA